MTSDSSSYAVMTAGSYTVEVVRRSGRLATVSSGDLSLEIGDAYDIEDAGREADDPGLRELRLRAVSMFGGLAPGVSVDGAEDLDPELCEMTLSEPQWPSWWLDAMKHENLDEVVERYLGAFADTTNQPRDAARGQLKRLISDGVPRGEHERAVVWNIWKEIRTA